MKYGNLNFLEPSGPVQACNGTDLSSLYMFLLLLFWNFLEPNIHFSLTVLLVPVNQTPRDSAVLNVVCLSLVVDSGQWHIFVCMSACVHLCMVCVCVLITHQGHKPSNSECSVLINR